MNLPLLLLDTIVDLGSIKYFIKYGIGFFHGSSLKLIRLLNVSSKLKRFVNTSFEKARILDWNISFTTELFVIKKMLTFLAVIEKLHVVTD